MVTKSDYIEAKDASLDASVVILTYNGEQHIDEILASLTTQRFDGTYEILVIDSGSTDSNARPHRQVPVRASRPDP